MRQGFKSAKIQKEKAQKFLYKGNEYIISDLIEIASKQFNVLMTQSCFYGRINRGWSVEEAVESPLRTTRSERFHEFRGQFKTLKEWAHEYGIPHVNLSFRVYQEKMSIEEALTRPYKSLKQAISEGIDIDAKFDQKEYSKSYYEQNKDHLISDMKEYYKQNKDRILRKHAEYREKNREYFKQRSRSYYEKNKEQILAKAKEKYHAKKLKEKEAQDTN